MTHDPPTGENSWETTEWYEVKPGDTLATIAAHYYGDALLAPRVFEANTDIIRDPDRLEVGLTLRIP